MFGPWIEVFTFFKGLVPDKLSWPHFSFITLHYAYIIGWTIIGSVILYPSKNMQYIDALFFGAGASTQSGLNPLNVNDIYLYQQVTLILISCITNPVFINTSVVFVRLYWFEKRFQNVVLEAQKLRRTRERSHTKSEMDEEKSIGHEAQRRIGGRQMVVVRPGDQTISQAARLADDDDDEADEHNGTGDTSSDTISVHTKPASAEDDAVQQDPDNPSEDATISTPFRRDIMFADEPKPARERRQSELIRLPASRTADQHIDFLEKQRNAENDDVLYIPGPRDFDRGHQPQRINWASDESPGSPARPRVSNTERFQSPDEAADTLKELNEDDHPHRDSSSPSNAGSSSRHAAVSRVRDTLRSRLRFRQGRNSNEESWSTKDKLASHEALGRRGRTSTFASFLTTRDEEQDQSMPYLSYQPTVGRNSMFVNLTEEQREELGGIEYRSLKLLATILCCYYVGFHLLGLVSYLPWIVNTDTYKPILYADGIDPAWWGVFTPASMFTDLGFALTPDSMSSFQYATWILLMGSFLIIIGNTGFPCMLRFTVWVLSFVAPKASAVYEELRFLLDHPRRCFTLLFPSKATWWLFWLLFLLNGIDLVFFIILDLNDPIVTSLPPGIRVLNGWFQAVSTRTAGFNVVDLAELHPAIQVSYLIMMYISVFPIAISVRRTNVYEERSLGIYSPDQNTDDADGAQSSYVGTHLRRQLSFDLWFVFLGLFIIAIVEGGRLADSSGEEAAFTLFAVLFEIVSAYGTVGLSLGYPNTDTSFSAQFHVISKLVIIAMQIRGRHRGLPYALDKAVLLPSENLQQNEAEEALRRASVRSTATREAREAREAEAAATRRRRSSRGGYGISTLLTQALSAGPTIPKRRD